MPRVVAAAALVSGALAQVACARTPAPRDPSERALFRDLERDVTVTAATGWGIDRLEIEGLLGTALDSVCRVDVLDRRAVRTWLDDRIALLGGPVEVAYHQRGNKLARVDELLVLSRVRALLIAADDHANDCPFWLEPQPAFRGRQISQHRWQLSFGGGGKAIVVSQGGQRDVSAGGAGRLLLGRMLAGGDGIYAGIELGGAASFPKDANGQRGSLKIGADVVVPVVYRRTLTNAYLELEGGWLGHATEDEQALEPGVHVGFAIGGRALRTRFLFPGAAIGVSYERTFVDGDDITSIKLGARVAFDLDL